MSIHVMTVSKITLLKLKETLQQSGSIRLFSTSNVDSCIKHVLLYTDTFTVRGKASPMITSPPRCKATSWNEGWWGQLMRRSELCPTWTWPLPTPWHPQRFSTDCWCSCCRRRRLVRRHRWRRRRACRETLLLVPLVAVQVGLVGPREAAAAVHERSQSFHRLCSDNPAVVRYLQQKTERIPFVPYFDLREEADDYKTTPRHRSHIAQQRTRSKAVVCISTCKYYTPMHLETQDRSYCGSTDTNEC